MAVGKSAKGKEETATLALGCFWEPDRTFSELPGVLSTHVGYTGGSNPEPSYQSVCSNDGHTESVQIHFDNGAVSYEDLLRTFFKEHNPTLEKGKAQYKSAIWYHSSEQKATAEAMIKQQSDKHGKPVVTDLAPAADWHDAEEYHQKYLSR